jgi:general nucleoside transport system permease protein
MASRAEVSGTSRRFLGVDVIVGQTLAFLAALAVAGGIGAVIIIAYGHNPLDIYQTIWIYSTSEPADFAQVLESATPLIFSGLAVAVAFKAGMFNIGVEGQYRVGMMSAAAAALALKSLPAFVLLPAVLIAAMLGAMVWAAIPAILKVTTGAHEVVTTIMMNGIATSLVAWALLNPLRTAEEGRIDLRTDLFSDKARMPSIAQTFGLEEQIPRSVHLTWLLPLALVACALLWWFLVRTRVGYEARAVGASSGSAEAGGVSIGATQVKVFLISGALAGFVGLNHILGDKGYLGSNYEVGLGFAGITIAFLGRNHPVGIALAAILIGMINRGQDGIQVTTDLPREILIILQGVLILAVVVAYEIARRALARRRQREERKVEQAAVAEPGVA